MKAFSVSPMILYIAGFVFVLFLFSTMIYPATLTIIQGECWGVGIQTTLKTIKSEFDALTPGGQEKKITVNLGDCVEYIAFVGKDNLERFYLDYFLESEAEGVFKCPKDFSVYIIAIPFFEESESGMAFWEWPKDKVKEEVEKIFKQKFRKINPFCDILDSCKDCYYNDDIEKRVMMGSGKDGNVKTYCITMKKISTKNYDISVEPGGC